MKELIPKYLSFFCILSASLFINSCSIPNLEQPECTVARDVVKRFYSFHFGNDMSWSPENLKAREEFLTNTLSVELGSWTEPKKDYFTATENYPKAFRVGECVVDSAQQTTFQVVLLWRDETKSEQNEVRVETVNIDGKWLINRVSN